jgi:hypothetical protein
LYPRSTTCKSVSDARNTPRVCRQKRGKRERTDRDTSHRSPSPVVCERFPLPTHTSQPPHGPHERRPKDKKKQVTHLDNIPLLEPQLPRLRRRERVQRPHARHDSVCRCCVCAVACTCYVDTSVFLFFKRIRDPPGAATGLGLRSLSAVAGAGAYPPAYPTPTLEDPAPAAEAPAAAEDDPPAAAEPDPESSSNAYLCGTSVLVYLMQYDRF